MSLMASFCAVLFPLDVLDEIWDLIEPVSEGFPTYSYIHCDKKCMLSSQPLRERKREWERQINVTKISQRCECNTGSHH